MQNVPYNTVPTHIPNAPAAGTSMLAPAIFNPLTPSRKHSARMPGLAGTNAAFLVPDNVCKKFMDGGWSSHVPLTYLTDKGCHFKDKSSTISA